MARVDVLTSVLELVVVAAVVAAVAVTAVLVGAPWCWPVGLVDVAVVAAVARWAVRAQAGARG